MDKDFVNKSTETSDIVKARIKRDEIIGQLDRWVEEAKHGKFNMLLDKYSTMDKDDLEEFRDAYLTNLYEQYPWAGHREQGTLPNPTDDEMAKLDAMDVALGIKVKPSKYGLTMNQAMLSNFKYKDYSSSTHLNHKRSIERLNKFLRSQMILLYLKSREDIFLNLRNILKLKIYQMEPFKDIFADLKCDLELWKKRRRVN